MCCVSAFGVLFFFERHAFGVLARGNLAGASIHCICEKSMSHRAYRASSPASSGAAWRLWRRRRQRKAAPAGKVEKDSGGR